MSEVNRGHGEPSIQSYNRWANAVSEITGGEIWYDDEGDCVDIQEPLVRGVETPEELIDKFGRKINVCVLGDSQAGYTIRVRGRWPRSGVQLSYHIVPREQGKVLIASEETRSKRFILKPSVYESDYTKPPRDETIEHVNPELDTNQQNTLQRILYNTAVVSKAKGIDRRMDP